MFLIWIVIIAVIIWAFKDKLNLNLNQENALEILKKHYAKGEISKDEFDEMKKNLI